MASAKAAEAGGVTTSTLMDHWFQMEDAAPATVVPRLTDLQNRRLADSSVE